MEIKKVVDKLENHSEFKIWKEKNKESYLANVFRMEGAKDLDEWQVGYYNKDGTVTSFTVGEGIKILPDQEIFQKEKKAVHELDVSEVKIDLDQALDAAKEFQKEKLKGNDPSKIMVVVQNIAGNTLYNITYITITFNTLNMKIDAGTGEMIDHEITPMLQFQGKAS
jgi:hypothetical protein|tara:strand:- start:323 stop:823 length:501 start_codon:yes stop_codon:yes gene_type:complete